MLSAGTSEKQVIKTSYSATERSSPAFWISLNLVKTTPFAMNCTRICIYLRHNAISFKVPELCHSFQELQDFSSPKSPSHAA